MHSARLVFLSFVVILGSVDLIAQRSVTSEVKASERLRRFFQALRYQDSQKPLPSHEDLLNVKDPIGAMSALDLSTALPDIFQALTHSDDRVKVYAASAVFSVSLRPDSSVVMGSYMDQILALLESKDGRLQATPAVTILNLKPTPPPAAVPSLVRFVQRTDRDPQAQVAAVFTLARLAPQNAEALTAINAFLRRPMEVRIRIDALNAVGTPDVADTVLRRTVRGFLKDLDPGVRFTAVGTIRRMGKAVVSQARSELRQMATTDEDPAVRKAAKDALSIPEAK